MAAVKYRSVGCVGGIGAGTADSALDGYLGGCQVLHDPLEQLQQHFPHRQHRQRHRREQGQPTVRVRPGESDLSGVHAGYKGRRHGEVHYLQRVEGRVRDVPYYESQPTHHRRVRQAL